MSNNSKHTFQALGRFVAPVCLVACMAMIAWLVLPYESHGGVSATKMEIREEAVPEDFKLEKQTVEPTHIHAKVINLAVRIEGGDHYTCKATLCVLNNEEVGSSWMVATIPAARVQRIFELAMALKNYNDPVNYQKAVEIEAWGYKTTPPEGTELMNAVFYTIVEAKIWDTDLSNVVLQPWMVQMF